MKKKSNVFVRGVFVFFACLALATPQSLLAEEVNENASGSLQGQSGEEKEGKGDKQEKENREEGKGERVQDDGSNPEEKDRPNDESGQSDSEEHPSILVTMIIEGPNILVDGASVEVASECEIQAIGNETKEETTKTFSGEFVGICALVATQEQGLIQDFEVIDFGWGLWLDSINGVATTADFSKFWALSHDGEEAQVGIADLVIKQGDEIGLAYPIVSDQEENNSEEETEDTSPSQSNEETTDTDTNEGEPQEPNRGGGGSGSGSGTSAQTTQSDISTAVESALSYLKEQGNSPDRSIAFAAAREAHDVSFLKTFSGEAAISYAKPILALTASGKDPRSYPNGDWVAKMNSFADGMQMGDPSLVNDDIWAILALISAGVPASDSVIQNSKTFILTNQNTDGGWAWNVGGDSDTNDTAAAVMALLETGVSKSDPSMQNAISYFKLAQNDDGGFPYDPKSPFGTDSDGNSDAWILMAINKLGESVPSWTKNGKSPIDHLLSLQDADGGFWWMAPPAEFNNKGPTADAVIALLDKSFPLHSISVSSQVVQGQEEIAGGAASGQLSGENIAEKTALGKVAQELVQIAREAKELQRQIVALLTARAVAAIQKEAPKVAEEILGEEMDEERRESMLAENQEEFQSSVFSEESSEVPFRAEAKSTGFMEFLRGNGWLVAGVLAMSVVVGFGLYRFGLIPRAKRRLSRK